MSVEQREVPSAVRAGRGQSGQSGRWFGHQRAGRSRRACDKGSKAIKTLTGHTRTQMKAVQWRVLRAQR